MTYHQFKLNYSKLSDKNCKKIIEDDHFRAQIIPLEICYFIRNKSSSTLLYLFIFFYKQLL